MDSHALVFIQDLAVVMVVAGLMTIFCHAFKQPIVFGYLIAGIIIGPYTPPFALISNHTIISTMAELGVIFLMFYLGLEFNLVKLARIGMTAFVAAFAEIILMILIGYEIGLLFGWKQMDALFLGAILSISSTTIIVKVLDELGLKKQAFAQLIFGILIIEDIFAILIIAVLSTLALSGTVQFQIIILTATKLVTFLVVSLLVGILFVPRLLGYVAKFKSNEMLLVSVLAICFGFCLIVIKMQYSVALGAFIIGAIIAESDHLAIIEELITPLRDMFSAIFFVSVGLLFDPSVVDTYLFPIILITIAVILGKITTSTLGVIVSGKDAKTAMRVGMGLAQIGEFSFIIAAMGISMKVTGSFLYSIAVAVSVITTLTTPYLIRSSYTLTSKTKVFVPKPLSRAYHNYHTWVSHIHSHQDNTKLSAHIKGNILHIVINLFVIMAIFLSAAFLATSQFGDKIIAVSSEAMQQTIIWSAALVISGPFLIAAHNRIRALGKNFIDLSEDKNIRISKHLRIFILGPTPALILAIVMLLVSTLTANILPPIGIVSLVIFIVTVILVLLSSWFVTIHTRLQKIIIKTIKKNKKRH